MSILLPASPLPKEATPRLLDFGAVLTPPSGGAAQKLNRLGNRHSISVQTPNLMPEPHGRIWASKLRQALREGAVMPFPQPGLIIGTPGAPTVDGAGQAGSFLAIKGGAPGYVVRDGQFLSVIIGGRRYLYACTTDTTLNGSGNATLPITPMLRISPPNNAIVELTQPMIEGFLSGNAAEWTHVIARTRGLTFTITEIE